MHGRVLQEKQLAVLFTGKRGLAGDAEGRQELIFRDLHNWGAFPELVVTFLKALTDTAPDAFSGR
jgi:hypothetical protein